MFFLVLTFLVFVNSTQLMNVDDQFKIIKRSVGNSSVFNLQKNQYFEVLNFRGLGRSIDINLRKVDPSLPNSCWAFRSTVRINHHSNSVQLLDDKDFQDLDNLSIEDLSNAAGESLLQMVHLKTGALVMSNQRLFLFQFLKTGKLQKYAAKLVDQKNISEYQVNQDFFDPPQLVYDNTTDYAFLIYFASTMKFKISATKIFDTFVKVESWVSRNDIGYVRISKGILYASCGSNGVDIYDINKKGNLKFLTNINATILYPNTPKIDIDIVDIAIGGKNDQYLYILDTQNGITQMTLNFGKSTYQQIFLNIQFGQIKMKGASAFEVYDQTLIVVKQQRVSSIAIEYYLDKHINWFEVNTYSTLNHFRHHIKGRIRDVDITKNFAVLTGMNTHRIIQHSIYQGFQNPANKQNEAYVSFYTGGLRVLDFFTTTEGDDQVIFGITGHSLVLYQWTEQPASIACFPFADNLGGKDLDYIVTFNTTQCDEKTKASEKNPNLIDPLIACQTTELFTIKVIQPLITDRQRNTITIILIGIGSILLFIALSLSCLYRRYTRQKGNFEREIKDFERRAKQSTAQKGQVLVEESDKIKN